MKKAVLYARVSSDLQQKERTIDSQIVEIKKQIAQAGDVLVKEYIDDGFSGAQLDRPGMNELRNELKTGTFDSVYFLNTDRIARDVTYQNIIIGEILRYKKQIIINGVDYIHNPENKFTLTVLGAVSELERAKIIERMTRGKMHRLNQGQLLGHGYNTFGYIYHRKTHESPARYEINKREAKIVKYIFETYAKGDVGMAQISKYLEEHGMQTREGQKLWGYQRIRTILANEAYTGIRYFHMMVHVKNEANPLYKPKYGKKVYRDRSEWIGIKIPTIVSKALYEKVKARREYNLACYRNPKRKQLLSNLIKCGECGRFFFAYRRYYKIKGKSGVQIYHKVAYMCNRRQMDKAHASGSVRIVCKNPQINAKFIEPAVFTLIGDVMTKPEKLRENMDFFKKKGQINQIKMEKELVKAEEKIKAIAFQKKRILDLYAKGQLSQEEYVGKNLGYDNETNSLKFNRIELLKKIPLLHKKDVIEVGIAEFCEGIKTRLNQATDFDSKRQLLLDFIQRVEYQRNSFKLYGGLPINIYSQASFTESNEVSYIEFCIHGKIDRDVILKKLRGHALVSGQNISSVEYGQLMLVSTKEIEK